MTASGVHRGYIGLGSNEADPPTQIARAVAAIEALPGTLRTRCSSLYRTPPWGKTDQPDFVNAVVELDTMLDAPMLLEHLRTIERAAGRARSERWGPRTLDLDLLLHGDHQCDTATLVLPHPRMHERAFVLVPLAELAPMLQIPGRGRVRDLLAVLDRHGIEALP